MTNPILLGIFTIIELFEKVVIKFEDETFKGNYGSLNGGGYFTN